ncbi:MAG: hypothetical protein IKN63_01615 [Bacilli bacterium]|nr:hypothetical protein [Bacilli bacterium]
MEEEVKKLKLEIEVLKKRIATLEGIERRRKIFAIIKIVLIITIFVALALVGYQFYQKMMNYYNQLNNIVTNPFDMFSELNLPTF